jgi:hypothetical protein
VIARVFPESYDAEGRSVFRPDVRRRGIKPTFPFGRFFSQPLQTKCTSIADIRHFLCSCRAASDQSLFGKEDYWQPPDEFEVRRKGDCEDFSLWTWRQLLLLGYDARFVMGECSRYGIGHAWVTFEREGEYFLVEPQLRFLGDRMPTLSTLRYNPKFSVSWDGERAHWFKHEYLAFTVDQRFPLLVLEWFRIWGACWLRLIYRLPIFLYKRVRRKNATTEPHEQC